VGAGQRGNMQSRAEARGHSRPPHSLAQLPIICNPCQHPERPNGPPSSQVASRRHLWWLSSQMRFQLDRV
jgi:hypothetical protein